MNKWFAKCDKHYVSEIDRFLVAFDKTHPQRSESQQQEIIKYARIFRLRDVPTENSSAF